MQFSLSCAGLVLAAALLASPVHASQVMGADQLDAITAGEFTIDVDRIASAMVNEEL